MDESMADDGLDTGQLEQLAGITRRRLDYAVGRNILTPVKGSDGRKRYPIHEVMVARAIFKLRERLTAPNGGALAPGLVEHVKTLSTLQLTSAGNQWSADGIDVSFDLSLTAHESKLADLLSGQQLEI